MKKMDAAYWRGYNDALLEGGAARKGAAEWSIAPEAGPCQCEACCNLRAALKAEGKPYKDMEEGFLCEGDPAYAMQPGELKRVFETMKGEKEAKRAADAEGLLQVLQAQDPHLTDALLGGFAKRVFETGASRDTDVGKLDFEGFLSPDVLEAFANYMNQNRTMADGSTRASDNWQKGIPLDAYMKSAWRHFHQVWAIHRAELVEDMRDQQLEALCGLLFNVQGYMHEVLKRHQDLLGY